MCNRGANLAAEHTAVTALLAERLCELCVSQRKEGLSWGSFGEVTSAYASVGDVWNIGSVSACLARWHCHPVFFWRSLESDVASSKKGYNPVDLLSFSGKPNELLVLDTKDLPTALAQATSASFGSVTFELRLSACLATSHIRLAAILLCLPKPFGKRRGFAKKQGYRRWPCTKLFWNAELRSCTLTEHSIGGYVATRYRLVATRCGNAAIRYRNAATRNRNVATRCRAWKT